MLLRVIAIVDDHGKPRAIFGADNDADGLGHTQSFAQIKPSENLPSGSEH